MELNVKKLEQGPVMADKGDISRGKVGESGPVVVETANKGRIGGPINSSGNPSVNYQCNF